MPIENRISGQELLKLQYLQDEFGTDVSFVERIITHAHLVLRSVGITDASIEILKNAHQEAHFGATRLPLLITLPDGRKYVLKRYEKSNIIEERSIIREVQGQFSPHLLAIGRLFFIEEYIDVTTYSSLEDVARTGDLETAVDLGSQIFGLLAQKGIRYHNSHFLDEFYVNNQGQMRVADFGAAHYFLNEEKLKSILPLDLLRRFYYDNDEQALFEYFKEGFTYHDVELPFVWNQIITKQIIVEAKSVIEQKGLTCTANLIETIKSAFFGLKYFLQENDVNNPWYRAIEYLPKIFSSIVKTYLALDQTLDIHASIERRDLQVRAIDNICRPDLTSGHIQTLFDTRVLRFARNGMHVMVILVLPEGQQFFMTGQYLTGKQVTLSWASEQYEKDLNTQVSHHLSLDSVDSGIRVNTIIKAVTTYLNLNYFNH